MMMKLGVALVLAFAAPAEAATYAFNKDSVVTYHMVHPLHAITGTTHTLRGKVVVTNAKLVTPLTLTLPLITFDSGNTNRDTNALLALGAGKFPSASLAITSFTERSRVAAGQAFDLAGDATGTLTLHGVTKPITVPLTAHVASDGLIVDGEFDVSLTAFGIARPALMFKPVDDAVRVKVHGRGALVP